MSDDLRALLGDKWTSKFVEAGPDEGHLRAVSASANARNRAGANANSASGARGVWWHGEQGRWVAQVGRLRQAGFETKTEAEAYVMGAHAALGWVTTTGGQP